MSSARFCCSIFMPLQLRYHPVLVRILSFSCAFWQCLRYGALFLCVQSTAVQCGSSSRDLCGRQLGVI